MYLICDSRISNINQMSKKSQQYSSNRVINKGHFHGLSKEVVKRTGLSRPLVDSALKTNDVSTDKRMAAVNVALQIIQERAEAQRHILRGVVHG